MFIKANTNIDFIKQRFITIGGSFAIVILTFILLFTRGLNYGIDFKGGIVMELKTEQTGQTSALREKFKSMEVGETIIQEFGSGNDYLVKIEAPKGGEKEITAIVNKVKATLGPDVSYRRVETIGPKVGSELISQSLWAVICALFLIFLYVWVRYEWQFSLSTTIALICDCVMILTFYVLFHRYEFNMNSIIAILMTAGYSVNDKVVVFDRIGENLAKYGRAKDFDLGVLINKSLNEVLTRTVLSSSTTIVALIPLYLLGGEVISSFSLPMIIGIVFGTFSSIFVASPLLLFTGYKVRE